MEMTVLVTEVSYFAAIGLIKLLRQLRDPNLQIWGCSHFPEGKTSGSLLVDHFYQSPPVSESESYLSFITALCKKEDIALIFSSDEDELLLLRQSCDHLTCKLVCAASEVLQLFVDKLDASLAVQSLGIMIPPIVHDLCMQAPKSGKIIFRKRHSVASRGIYKVDLNSAQMIENRFTPDTFIQECIEGQEYTVDILCDRSGVLKMAIPRKRLDIRSGISYKCQLEYVPVIIEACQKLYRTYSIPGLSNAQFMLQENQAYFIELNPRFAGTGIASSLASFNVLTPYLAHFCMDVPMDSFENYMRCVAWDSIITRYYEETVSHQ